VIIPVLNEADQLGASLHIACAADGIELIVVDGGSNDETVRIARNSGARLVRSAPGRARQMNAGAVAARGKVLLFLHADTHLPHGYADEIERTLAEPRVMLTAFRLKINHEHLRFRVTEAVANFRARWLGLPYGDQGLAIRTVDFFRLGGFRNIPIMEDFDLARRAACRGRIVIARSAARTSARRWIRCGWLKLTLIHQACILAYRLGVSPNRIAAWRGNDSNDWSQASCIHTDDKEATVSSSEHASACSTIGGSA
jgi:rSAM/selenodomain-associated transferase 2